MSFKEYLAHNEIDVDNLPQVVTVEVMRDESCDMAYITVNDVSVHYGNDWDFHDGCLAHPDIGEFNSIEELTEIIEIGLNELGHAVEIVNGEFSYND